MISKLKFSLNRLLTVLLLIFAIPSALFWGIGIFAVFGPDVTEPVAFVAICLSFLAASISLIIFGFKHLRFLQLCKNISVILSAGSVSDVRKLAGILGMSIDRTRSNLQKMITKSYICGVYLEFSTDKIVFLDKEKHSNAPLIAVKCACCGGTNMLPQGTSGKCAYCDSAINV